MNRIYPWALSVCLCLVAAATFAADQKQPVPDQAATEQSVPQSQPPAPATAPKIGQMQIDGAIDGRNIAFTLAFDVDHKNPAQVWPLITGDVVLEDITSTGSPRLDYDAAARSYQLGWPRAGQYHVEATFAVRPTVLKSKDELGWHEASFTVPASRVRELRIVCDRVDLEVHFVGALRQQRAIEDGKLIVSAILGPGRPFVVRWKPQVQALDAALMLSARTNTIARISPGALRLDSVFSFGIAQGKLDELSFDVPASLSVTQVRGRDIRDWKLGEGDAANNARRLTVQLSRPQTGSYDLQIVAEQVLEPFPSQVAMPVITVAGDVRGSGHLAVGTDSAIQMIVKQTAGLSQIDAAAFPRDALDPQHPRALPSGSAFFYSFASNSYQLALSLDDIVPAYDASHRITATVREDDLVIEAQIELDVRDAPLRSVSIDVPAGWSIASLTGPMVDDYRAPASSGADATRTPLVVHFKQPVIGRTLIALRLELGHSPLEQAQTLASLNVQGAVNQRGYVVVASEQGVQLQRPAPTDLREVHTGSVPMRVAEAQFAYRFRDPTWTLKLQATRKTPGIRAEAFELVSLGEAMAYGSVVVNYFISGAPIDELKFRAAAGLDGIEFVGRDVRRWTHDGDVYTVKLSRKVVGDYNLGVFYRQRYAAPATPGTADTNDTIGLGGIEPLGAQTQTGFITVASHLNLQLDPVGETTGLLEISRDEVPANYRLLISAPVLRTYKYVSSPHRAQLAVRAYDRGQLLPVVIELMQMRTEVAIDDASRAESVTRVRYKVKNTSSQFLPLNLPTGASVWSTHLVDFGLDGAEQRQRINASFDPSTGQLLVPLKRTRNPNDPITLDIEYGQSHGQLTFNGDLALTAPTSTTRSTFVDWTLTAPNGWAVRNSEHGNMLAEPRSPQLGDLSRLLAHARDAWASALGRVGRGLVWLFVAIGFVGVVILVAVLRRSAAGPVAALMAVALLTLIGAMAAASPGYLNALNQPDDLRQLTFTQPVNLGDAQAPSVAGRFVPAWRQHATFVGAIVVPAAAIVCLLGAVAIRRLRSVLAALGVTGLIYGAAQFDVVATDSMRLPVALALGHLMTWGIPLALLAYLTWRWGMRLVMAVPRQAATAAAVLLVMTLGHISSAQAMEAHRPMDINIIQRVDTVLTAERDSMAIEYHVTFRVNEPKRFQLLGSDAVLMSEANPQPNVRLVVDADHHWIELDKAGVYELTLKFLAPLAPADDQGQRSFCAPLPPALTNRVKLVVPAKGMAVTSSTAVRFNQYEQGETTVVEAIVGARDPVNFTWKPRLRQTKLEKTVFYAETTSLLHFDAALATGLHDVHLQIAQGEVRDVKVKLPAGMTVSGVEGRCVGAWRYDPADSQLEVKLTQPVSGEYVMRLRTQVAGQSLPWSASVGGPSVMGAAHQRGAIGLITRPSVYLQVSKHPQTMNADDLMRAAADLLKAAQVDRSTDLRFAYRVGGEADRIELTVHEVKPELRAAQTASFSIGDERLAFNAELAVDVAKAGVFSIELKLPAAYDIDTLTAPQVSHWDETVEDGVRRVQVHFTQKLLGRASLKIALSRPVSQTPSRIDTPRIQVVGALKHTGRIDVQAVRGTRLSIAEREGVSELNPLELGMRDTGVLVFKLLRPDWKLTLATEVVEPRITVDYLHVAQISEAMVRHNHYLRYHLAHAGAKVFEVVVPDGSLGVLITGPEIANMKPVDGEPNRWRIELARKWYDQPYPLSVRYETRFDMNAGLVSIQPLGIEGGDLYRGHVVIRTSDKVELKSRAVGPTLTAGESRTIDARFGAGDLSDAAFTYDCASDQYALSLDAKRHDAAALLEADVTSTTITTVVNERGQSISRVQLDLKVGSKRHLAMRLPDGATIWSLMVNRRATVPSMTTDAAGQSLVLIPLGHAGAGELPVAVDLTYINTPASRWSLAQQRYEGPQFDLPLKNIRWVFYLPPDLDYSDFEGTLNVDDQTLRAWTVVDYGVDTYQEQVAESVALSNSIAMQLQSRGEKFAKAGQQYKARAALESAYNYSFNDQALNEDARVQLHKLTQQQAMIGLKSRRAYLRPQGGAQSEVQQVQQQEDLGDQFSQAQADRELASMDRFDSENLQRISERIIGVQEAAAGAVVPLEIHLPTRGRVVAFERPLQVQPDSEMAVRFDAEPIIEPAKRSSGIAFAGLFAGLCLLMTVAPRAVRKLTPNQEPSNG
ncbi:hypothetical protein HED60_12005 [Planctomycetales bacterium ZRK34]|nr:hypothetical protein HED60_12005 [Planctomycetales bacterium ZRK34]